MPWSRRSLRARQWSDSGSDPRRRSTGCACRCRTWSIGASAWRTSWGADARRLADWVCGAATSAEIARRLQSGLKDRAARAAPADGDMTAVFALLRDGGSHTTPSVANVVAQLRLSERTLRRRCHHAFGYGPKTLERILRFQRFLALARRFSGNGLARCAAEAGYADQAHLSREVRQLCGLSPRAVVDQIA